MSWREERGGGKSKHYRVTSRGQSVSGGNFKVRQLPHAKSGIAGSADYVYGPPNPNCKTRRSISGLERAEVCDRALVAVILNGST